jgi:hypothetical protein
VSTIALHRLYKQRLRQTTFRTAGEVVAYLGAVQAQEYAGAKWALSLRMQQASDDVIDTAFNEGEILRTHVMRPTWHFVTSEDIRWILELTAPRVHTVNGHMYRKLELDETLFRRSHGLFASALEGGTFLTRAELADALAQGGIHADGMRLGYIVHHAELEAVLCSGPRRGRQFTYALLDERAPQARRLSRDVALAELTLRYYTSHGPATVADFAWWSGLTKADVKAGLAMCSAQLLREEIEGQAYWFSPDALPAPDADHRALLLPTYDEYIIGYTDRSALFGPSLIERLGSRGDTAFHSMIIIHGHIVGTWRRSINRGLVHIDMETFRPLSAAQENAVHDAAQRYGDFLGMPVSLG